MNYNNASFNRAQAAYENRLPDDDDVPTEECPECEGSGKLPMSKCCESEIQNGVCMECHETTQQADCYECDGTGEVECEKPEPDWHDVIESRREREPYED